MSTEVNSPFLEDTKLRADIDRSLRHPVMFFFASAAAWLAVSLILGIITSVKTHSPGFLDCCSFLNAGVTMQAHMSTLIYGWGAQAAFGVIIWLMARLSRQESKRSGIILTAGHLWNAMIAIGTVCILAGEGSGIAWMYFPKAIWPVLIGLYFVIGIWSVISFRVRRGGHIYISQWYILASLFWFPWVLLTGYLFTIVFLGEGHPMMVTATSAWFRSALLFLFFTPVAIASSYYIAPKVTGRPVYSYNLAIFGFWALAIIGPWVGMQRLMGAPIPAFMPYLSAGAAILLLIPAIAVAINILRTASSKSEAMAHSPSLRFTVAGAVGLLLMTGIGALISLPSVMKYTQFSTVQYGFELTAMLGFFSMCMYGAIYFIVPRVTNREWISVALIRQHFWLSIYGVLVIALVYTVAGGFMHGYIIEKPHEAGSAAYTRLYPYAIALTTGFIFLLISTFFFCIHLLLMWLRLGRRSSHPTLLVRHAHGNPHGPEGDLDKLTEADDIVSNPTAN